MRKKVARKLGDGVERHLGALDDRADGTAERVGVGEQQFGAAGSTGPARCTTEPVQGAVQNATGDRRRDHPQHSGCRVAEWPRDREVVDREDVSRIEVGTSPEHLGER